MIYGYCRVSTRKQKLDRQIANINKVYPEARIYSDKYTGTKLDRPEFNKLLKVIKSGDTIVFDSVSRMSRNAEEGYKLYAELYSNGVNLEFIKEPHINSDTYKKSIQASIEVQKVDTGKASTDKLISSILEAINQYTIELAKEQIKIAFEQAEKEVNDLHIRVSEGMQKSGAGDKISKANTGKTFNTVKSYEAKANIIRMSKDFNGSMTDKQILEVININRNTYYKYKRELLALSLPELEAFLKECEARKKRP